MSLQNVLNATRIIINPDIDEAVKFKEGYVSLCCMYMFIYSSQLFIVVFDEFVFVFCVGLLCMALNKQPRCR